ncbi:MAG TPA: hypothetical protein VGQ13_01300 [Nitrososphaera sp.]|jgi:hypothetical protein|nr:hypothetical protein [Nitrososphaera sp.]
MGPLDKLEIQLGNTETFISYISAYNAVMRLVLEPKRLYRITALIMIIIGSSLIAIVLAAELTPRKQIECIFDATPGIGDRCLVETEQENNFLIYLPPYATFILLVSGVSLIAFGGSILGMVLRLGR